ncbi:MAG: ABC transporter permease, partial [Solirubrobacteraceae bacterium]
MRLSTIFYLYRVRLRARFVQELLAVAGIAVGVALLFASQVANTSLSGSVTRITNGLVGSARLQLAARDPHGFSESLLGQIERLRGVRSAVPVLQRDADVVGPRGEEAVDLIGLDTGFVRLQGRLLSHVSATQLPRQQGVALPAPVAREIGAGSLQSVSIQVGDSSMRALTAVVLQASDIGELVDSRLAISPLGLAQSLAGMRGRVSRILVEPLPGRDREVERELERVAGGRLNVLPANFEAAIFRQAEAPTAQSTEMFSAISALVGFLFAFNAILLTVPQRRNLIADLRLDGYTPGEILEVMLFDVFALGMVGIGCGLALGELLSRSLLQADPGYLSLAFPVQSLHIVSWQNVAIAAVGGFVAAVVGVMVPLRHEIFRNDQVGPHRPRQSRRTSFTAALIGGVGCIVVTTAILVHGITAVGAAILAFVSLMLGLLLVMPAAFGGIVSLINRVQRSVMGVSLRIALIELMSSTSRSRSLAIAATGAVAVFGCVAIEGARSDLSTGLSR